MVIYPSHYHCQLWQSITPVSLSRWASCRFTWDVIRRNRAGRAIVLTTHSMEEADLLADHIAIMANGHIVAEGTSMDLKSRYGVGYTLTLAKQRADGSRCATDMLWCTPTSTQAGGNIHISESATGTHTLSQMDHSMVDRMIVTAIFGRICWNCNPEHLCKDFGIPFNMLVFSQERQRGEPVTCGVIPLPVQPVCGRCLRQQPDRAPCAACGAHQPRPC